jgi:hypothetical protein
MSQLGVISRLDAVTQASPLYPYKRTSRNAPACPLSANSGLMHCSKPHRHSITSSAVASSVGGTVRPSAFAVIVTTCIEVLHVCRCTAAQARADRRESPANVRVSDLYRGVARVPCCGTAHGLVNLDCKLSKRWS